jgi:hypothetical protein
VGIIKRRGSRVCQFRSGCVFYSRVFTLLNYLLRGRYHQSREGEVPTDSHCRLTFTFYRRNEGGAADISSRSFAASLHVAATFLILIIVIVRCSIPYRIVSLLFFFWERSALIVCNSSVKILFT